MPRQARVILPGVPHHITHKGNALHSIFLTDQDRLTYLQYLQKSVTENTVEVHAYCLMTNHIHLVVTPETAPGLSRAIQSAHHKYALYFNVLNQRTGHLWQDRFFSCPMDDEYFWKALRYVELNPVRARMVAHATDYQWSSARAHTAHQGKSRILDLPKWRAEMPPSTWRDILAQNLPQAETQRIRDTTKLGRPLGSELFIKDTERTLGRILHPKPSGRPKV